MISLDEVRSCIDAAIDVCTAELSAVNDRIHSTPELSWEERTAHSVLTNFLSTHTSGFKVTQSAYNITTAFEARSKPSFTQGRTVNFNAEYDALPGIGHGCGHNLIALSSLAAFVALSAAVRKFGIEGNVQLLGTPAEEAGGGKIQLLENSAFEGVDVSLMGHPIPLPRDESNDGEGFVGIAGQRSVAHLGLFATFLGKNAHAAMNPWDGINALDALVCAYNNISVLRQQMRPDETVHGCIIEAPKVANVIPSITKVYYSVRSATMTGARKLGDRVSDCLRAAALATGCSMELTEEAMYADLRVNNALSEQYASNMALYNDRVKPIAEEPFAGSTDQGNVTYVIPALHVSFGIPAGSSGLHEKEFAVRAGTNEAFQRAIRAGKGLALTGWEVLTNDKFYARVRDDFEKDQKRR